MSETAPLTARITELEKELKEKQKALDAIGAAVVADQVVGVLKTRYAVFAGLAFVLFSVVAALAGQGILKTIARGVFADEAKYFEEQANKARTAAEAATAREALLAEREKELRQQATTANQAVAAAKTAAEEVQSALSELRGDIDRSQAASDQKMIAIEERLAKVVNTLDEGVRVQIERLATSARTDQEEFNKRAKVSVAIIYYVANPGAMEKAKGFQKTLARQGYTTTVVGSDFSEIGGPREKGSVQVVGRDSASASSLTEKLGLESRYARVSATRTPGTFQIFVF